MGTKHRIGFGVYKVMGSVNVQLAEKTGFSQDRGLPLFSSAFPLSEEQDDAPLSGLYLLGFHNQSYDLRKKKEEEK